MASWTQKKQLFAIGGGAALVCALAIGGVYYAHGLIDEINASIDSKKEAIAAATTKIAQIPALEKDVVILRENLGKCVKILPDTKELYDFVRMLNQFERQSGISGTGLVLKSATQAKGNERFAKIEYGYQMRATLWEFLKFVNLIENYERFVCITDFSITSGDKGRGDEQRGTEAVHTVSLSLQTYTYNGKPSGKDAEIPNYAGLVESLQEEIVKRGGIQIEKYTHRGDQGRRDVLVDPRLRGGGDIGSGALPPQQKVLERNIAEVKSLRDVLQRLRRADTTMFEQYGLERRLKEGIAKLAASMESDANLLTFAPLRVKWAKEVVAPFDELRSAVEKNGKNPGKPVEIYLPQKEMEQLVAQLEADCQAGQLEEAKTHYENVATRLAVPPEDPRHELAVAAKAWHVRATTALDFKSLDLKMQGVVVNHGGRSGVLLNGEVYEEGEYVTNELLVKRVEEEQVWFVFRGLTLVRTM